MTRLVFLICLYKLFVKIIKNLFLLKMKIPHLPFLCCLETVKNRNCISPFSIFLYSKVNSKYFIQELNCIIFICSLAISFCYNYILFDMAVPSNWKFSIIKDNAWLKNRSVPISLLLGRSHQDVRLQKLNGCNHAASKYEGMHCTRLFTTAWLLSFKQHLYCLYIYSIKAIVGLASHYVL